MNKLKKKNKKEGIAVPYNGVSIKWKRNKEVRKPLL